MSLGHTRLVFMITFVVVDHCTKNNVVLMDYIQLKMDGI